MFKLEEPNQINPKFYLPRFTKMRCYKMWNEVIRPRGKFYKKLNKNHRQRKEKEHAVRRESRKICELQMQKKMIFFLVVRKITEALVLNQEVAYNVINCIVVLLRIIIKDKIFFCATRVKINTLFICIIFKQNIVFYLVHRFYVYSEVHNCVLLVKCVSKSTRARFFYNTLCTFLWLQQFFFLWSFISL